MSAVGTVILVGLTMAVSLVELYGLWSFWPTSSPVTGSVPPMATFSYFSWHPSLTRDQQFFVVAALAGAIGATVHSLRSLSTYIGERYLYRSWIPYYLLLPLVGTLLATVVYLALRAGLLTGSTASSQPDPYGVAAIGVLVGLFSAQAAEKMKAVFETLFTKVAPGEASIPGNTMPPVIGEIVPPQGPPGTAVMVSGHNLVSVTRVSFTRGAEADFGMDPRGRLIVKVPEDAVSGLITLHVDGQKPVVSDTAFRVERRASASARHHSGDASFSRRFLRRSR